MVKVGFHYAIIIIMIIKLIIIMIIIIIMIYITREMITYKIVIIN